jgi:hypothetical protein
VVRSFTAEFVVKKYHRRLFVTLPARKLQQRWFKAFAIKHRQNAN